MGRGLAIKRHNNIKMIKKRLNIMKSWRQFHFKWTSNDTTEYSKSKRDGMLRKHNLTSKRRHMFLYEGPPIEEIKENEKEKYE
jgi:hypothetical protein